MSFEQFAIAHGILIPDSYPSEKIRRCATADKPRSKNGAWFWDGIRGWVSDWAQGGDLNWFEGGEKRTFSEADKKAWAQKKTALQARQEQGWRNAALAAAIVLRPPTPQEHNYLHSKGQITMCWAWSMPMA